MYFIPILLVITLLNLIVDPANLFSGATTTISRILISGKNVTGSINIDERLLQKNIINTLEHAPETVVLGSSRIMLIGRTIYGHYTRNNGVSGASIEDLISIYEIYVQNNLLPKKIVIGIDPWLYNENSGEERWKSLENYYNDFIGIRKTRYSIYNYSQLFSITYFQNSMRNINTLFQKEPFYETDKNINDTFTRHSDGTIYYDIKYRNINEDTINERVHSYLTGGIYALENYSRMSERSLILFDRLIADMVNHGIEIEFVLMPYHPTVYEYLSTNERYSIITQVEEYIISYAKENNIILIGSFNPTKFNVTGLEFYDGMHVTPEGVLKVYKTFN